MQKNEEGEEEQEQELLQGKYLRKDRNQEK